MTNVTRVFSELIHVSEALKRQKCRSCHIRLDHCSIELNILWATESSDTCRVAELGSPPLCRNRVQSTHSQCQSSVTVLFYELGDIFKPLQPIVTKQSGLAIKGKEPGTARIWYSGCTAARSFLCRTASDQEFLLINESF